MAPRSMSFSKERVGKAALEIVREGGWEELTARSVARRLDSSVAPVYSVFGSMEALQAHVLEAAVGLLDASVSRRYTEGAFLNMGVGLAVFARDEPNLFLALYRVGQTLSDPIGRYQSELVERLRGDPVMGRLGAAALERLFERMWLFTIGLTFSLIYRYNADMSTEKITHTLRSAGAVMIYAELMGVGDLESDAARRTWERLTAEKGLAPSKTDSNIGTDPASRRNEQG